MEVRRRWYDNWFGYRAILGAATANPNEFLGYTTAEGAMGVGAFGAALGGVSGLIVGVIQNAAFKKCD